MTVFTVHDAKALTYQFPFAHHNTDTAIRAFSNEVNRNPDSPYAKHPEDFTLFELGEYDEETGHLAQHPTPMAIIKAIDLVEE